MKGEGMDKVREALAELVALKDLHDRCENMPSEGDGPAEPDAQAMWQEYRRRKPLAWAAAREALSVQPAEPVAWRYRYHSSGTWHFASEPALQPHADISPGFEQEPLFARQPAPSVPAVPTTFDVSLDQAACELLFKLMHPATPESEDYCEVRLQFGPGHSGHGLYVSQTEYPEEGSLLLAAAPHPAAKGGAE